MLNKVRNNKLFNILKKGSIMLGIKNCRLFKKFSGSSKEKAKDTIKYNLTRVMFEFSMKFLINIGSLIMIIVNSSRQSSRLKVQKLILLLKSQLKSKDQFLTTRKIDRMLKLIIATFTF